MKVKKDNGSDMTVNVARGEQKSWSGDRFDEREPCPAGFLIQRVPPYGVDKGGGSAFALEI